MSKQTEKDKTRWPALGGTLLFAILMFLLLQFLGLHFPVPAPPEYGIEVNLGYADQGLGEEAIAENMASASNAASAAEEEIITSQEEAPSLSVKPKKQHKSQKQPKLSSTQTVEDKPLNSTLNPNALYPGKRQNNSTSSSEGNKVGEGDMGQANGSSKGGAYEGGGSGGGGVSFSLNGRTLMSLVKPEYNSEEQGTVVVKIWVNREGTVVRTQVGVQGTTTMDEHLWETARRAAINSRFVPKENAPEEQVGNIRYKFVIGQ